MHTRLATLGLIALLPAAPALAQEHGGAGHSAQATAGHDTAFTNLQERGRILMGVDQYTSRHRFEPLADGGRIELQRIEDDSAGTATIRTHLRQIAAAFRDGDFTTPALVHMREVPGAAVMTERREMISYEYRDLPRGGELRIRSADARAIGAVHAFLAFQRQDHRAGH